MGIESNLLPTIFYGALLLFLLGAMAALWLRMGTVMNYLGRVEATSDATQKSVAEKTAAIEKSLNERVTVLQTSLTERMDALKTVLQISLNEKTDALNARVTALQISLDERTGALQASLNYKTDTLNDKIDALNEKVDTFHASTNARLDALQAAVMTLVNTQHEMQLQMQRNHYQLMSAILSHRHHPDGRITIDPPPDPEPAPADD